MKKIVSVLLVAMLLLAMAGCQKDDPATDRANAKTVTDMIGTELEMEELYHESAKVLQEMMDRTSIRLGKSNPALDTLPTDERIARMKENDDDTGLLMKYFAFGRYLLICSSYNCTLPANLQGVWNCHDKSPWGAGYWHNINVQYAQKIMGVTREIFA